MLPRARRPTCLALLLLVSLWQVGSSCGGATRVSRAGLRFFGTGALQQDRVRIAVDDDTPGPDASEPCDVGAGDFTVELWLRGTLADNDTQNAGGDVELFGFPEWIFGNIVVDRDIWGDSDADWGVSIAGGFVRFGTGAGDGGDDVQHTLEGGDLVLDGSWHHVAVVRDATTGRKRIYVDGRLDVESSPGVSDDDISYPDGGVADPVTPWGPYLVLAAEKHDAGPAHPSFAGYLDELRVWSVARTASQISNNYRGLVEPDAPGLVASYRFEEKSGTSLADSSAAGSADGELIAGVPGNGEWALYKDDGQNTAPVY